MKLVSIHVPKTGGTSMREALLSRYRVRPIYRGFPKVRNPEVVHGHITVQAAARRWPDVPIVAIVRDPFEQIRSNYDHYLHHPGTHFQPDIGRLPPGMTFEDFIVHPSLANYQCQFVNGPVDFLGRTDDLDEAVRQINDLFGLDIPTPGRFNPTDVATELSPEQQDLIERHHGGDFDLYMSAA